MLTDGYVPYRFWCFVSCDDGTRELVFDEIIDPNGEWETASLKEIFKDELEARDGDLHISLNCVTGGLRCCLDIFDLLYMYSLSGNTVTVTIENFVSGAPVVIMMAADFVNAKKTKDYKFGPSILLTEPKMAMFGSLDELKKDLDTFSEMRENYIEKICVFTKLNKADLVKMMADETWLDEEKMREYGFITAR